VRFDLSEVPLIHEINDAPEISSIP
jgi:hypothetical protein